MKGSKSSEPKTTKPNISGVEERLNVKKERPKEAESKRIKLLESLANAHVDTLKIIEQKMAGKTGAELAMLQNAARTITALMLNYRDLIDVTRQRELEMKQSKTTEATEENKKSGATASVSSIEEIVQKLAIKIEFAYKGLGFECETSVQKDGKNNFSIKAEPKMPEEFKGKDPFKLSLDELNRAREALVNEKVGVKSEGVGRSAAENTKSVATKIVATEQEKEKPNAVNHKDLGDFTHSIIREEEEKRKGRQSKVKDREIGA